MVLSDVWNSTSDCHMRKHIVDVVMVVAVVVSFVRCQVLLIAIGSCKGASLIWCCKAGSLHIISNGFQLLRLLFMYRVNLFVVLDQSKYATVSVQWS